MKTVLQKLLHPGTSQLIRERGYSQVGGSVVRTGDNHSRRGSARGSSAETG